MIRRALLPAVLLVLVLTAVMSVGTGSTRPPRSGGPARAASLPVMFEPEGAGTTFLARGRGYLLRVESSGVSLRLRDDRAAAPVRLEFDGGAGRIRPERRLDTTLNYFLGSRTSWRTGIPAFGAIRLGDLYPGIDALFYGTDRGIEYDLVVAPGADPRQIRLRFGGVDAVSFQGGDLRLRAGAHTLTQHAPVAYQQLNGRRTPVAARYTMFPDGSVGLSVGSHDRTAPLVIDPLISYSSYFGATGSDTVHGMATDASRNLYLVGEAQGGDFPVQNVAPRGQFDDGYVAKVRPDGTPEWLTFLGGSRDDRGLAIASGPEGDVYVTGAACSTDFPVTPGAYRPATGSCDAFVARLGPDASLKYSTMLGAPQSSPGDVGGTGIAVDPQGRAGVTGITSSPSFVPTIAESAGPRATGEGQPDGFVVRLSADGSSLDWSRLMAGSGFDYPRGIAIDQYGDFFVTGSTTSSDFPIRNAINPHKFEPGAPDGLSGFDGFLAWIWGGDGQIGYSTYLGGTGEDAMNAVVIGQYDRVYVAGTTTSPDASFYKPSPAGQYSGIMYEVSGSTLIASRPVGGTGYTTITSLAVGSDWSIWAAGYTDGADWQLVAPDDPAPQPGPAGGLDMFVQEWNPTLDGLNYSYLLGGAGNDFAFAITLDRFGDIYLGGMSESTNYPVRNAAQAAKKDASGTLANGVVTKLACTLRAFLPAETQPASGGEGFAYIYTAGGCAVDPVSDSAWLHVTGVDDNQVRFTTDPNPTSTARQGLITLSSKTVIPITQAASAGGGGTSKDEIVLNPRDISGHFGEWQLVPDPVHGTILTQPDRGAPKIPAAQTHPSNWFSFTFEADAGKPYHLWIHGRAQNDAWQNDSIYVQFSDSVDASGNPTYRTGTTSAAWVSLEECSGCGEQGWGWQDNEYGIRGVLGPDIYFASTGTHTIMLQTREDGFDIGQVVLSAGTYLRNAPGGATNDPTIVGTPRPPPPGTAKNDGTILPRTIQP
jgi:Putative binding domain, N-terminal/Beta-propeller repeat